MLNFVVRENQNNNKKPRQSEVVETVKNKQNNDDDDNNECAWAGVISASDERKPSWARNMEWISAESPK